MCFCSITFYQKRLTRVVIECIIVLSNDETNKEKYMTTATATQMQTIKSHTLTGRNKNVEIDPKNTSYVDVYESQTTRKFNVYLRDESRNDQPMFVADSIHPDYVPHHVTTGKVTWINKIPGKHVVVRVCMLDGSVRVFVKTRK